MPFPAFNKVYGRTRTIEPCLLDTLFSRHRNPMRAKVSRPVDRRVTPIRKRSFPILEST